MNLFKNIGPGTLVAAAFIGPGTVTVCTLAGVQFGHGLLWAMLLSIFSTIVLQESALRIGLVTQKGIAENIKNEVQNPIIKYLLAGLILGAVLIGNAAYEAGNISGAALGVTSFFPDSTIYAVISIGFLASLLLFVGKYKVIEKVLVAIVVLMSVTFIVGAILTKPDLLSMAKGLFIPKFPSDSILMIIGLVGTTVVPYNIFLHASLVNEKWNSSKDLYTAKKDLYISVILGGLVSLAIIIAAASIQGAKVESAADLAGGLEPVMGDSAKILIGIGLFAAGITSSITAPLAAAFVVRELVGWEKSLKSWKFRAVWLGIIVLGVLFSSLGFKPIYIIQFAQVTNGFLLPIIAILLLWLANKKSLLGNYKNSIPQNIFVSIIVLITIILGIRGIDKVFQFL